MVQVGSEPTRRILAIAAAGTDDVRGSAIALASEPVAGWSQARWDELDTVLDAVRGVEQLQVPTVISGMRSLHRLTASGRTDARTAESVQRYMTSWQAVFQTSGAADGPGLQALLRTPDASWNAEHWTAIATRIDAAGDQLPTHLLQLGSEPSFAQVASRAAADGPDRVARRYVAAWRMHLDGDSPQLRRSGAQDLLARSEQLDGAAWTRLAAIADNDLDRAVRGHVRAVRDLPDLADLATSLGGGERLSPQTRRAIDAWNAVVDGTAGDPDRLANEVRQLIATGTERRLDPSELRRFAALLDVDPDGIVLTAPRSLAGAPTFDTALRAHAEGIAGPEVVDRYVRAWNAHVTTAHRPDELRTQVRALIAQDPATLEAADWRSLSALVDADADGAILRVPTSIGGAEPFPALAGRAADGMALPPRVVDRYFAMWRLGLDGSLEPQDLRASMQSIVTSDRPSQEDWRMLGAILDLGAERTGAQPPAVVDRIDASTAYMVHEVASGQAGTTIPPQLDRVLAAWRAQVGLEGTGADAARHRLLELVPTGDEPVAPERWRDVRAILDAIDGVPGANPERDLKEAYIRLDVDHLASLTEPRAATTLLQRWLPWLDPAFPEARRASLLEGVRGGQLPDDFLPSELAELVPSWSTRSPFERLAVELGVGLHASASTTDARTVVSRVLDLQHAPADLPDALVPTWRETRRLAEVNLARLNGTTPRGEVRGYSNHPDYAQVGRIRSNVELMRRMTPSTVGDDAAATVTDGTFAW